MAIDESGKWWVGSEHADIQEYLDALTRSDGGYPATSYRLVRCTCGSDRFTLERAADVTKRTCVACERSKFVCRQAEDWEEAVDEEGSEAYSCVECKSKHVNVAIGFAGYDDPKIDGVKWLFVGVRCAECGILSCFNDCKVAWGPAKDVFESV